MGGRSRLATSLKQAPGRVPERPSGESPDILGKPTLRLTLQTRGQHIRMDKSTSNVGIAQMLLTDMAAMKAVHHRTDTVTFDVTTSSFADLVKTLEAQAHRRDALH